MLCQKCKKNPATVHMTELAGGKKKEVHLCEGCSHEEGVTLKGQISLADFLAGLIKAPANKEAMELAEKLCPDCGIDYLEFQSNGRFGCARDYEIFAKLIEPLVEKIHGSVQHVGKSPVTGHSAHSRRWRLSALRRQLKAAIDEEKYELAAELRDEVRKLEGDAGGTE